MLGQFNGQCGVGYTQRGRGFSLASVTLDVLIDDADLILSHHFLQCLRRLHRLFGRMCMEKLEAK